MKKYFLLVCFFISKSLSAEILVAHLQLKNLILNFTNTTTKVRTLEIGDGDPHHFSPNPKTLKEILQADTFIAPPKELSPWAVKLAEKRKTYEKTLILSLSHQHIELYGQDTNSLSHFWMYPEIACDFVESLSKNLKTTVKKCPDFELSKFHKEMKSLFKGKKVILSHLSVGPILKKWGAEVHTLRTKHHDHSLGPNSFKKLQNILSQNSKVIWIDEKQIHLPKSIKKIRRQEDLIISLDTLGNVGESPFKVLHDLKLKLEEAKI